MKKTFLIALVALVACVSMLTSCMMTVPDFWGEETGGESGNIIISGDLKLKTYGKNYGDENYKSLGDIEIFPEDIVWEPGKKACMAFKIENAGIIGLRYTYKLSSVDPVYGDDLDIKNVIEVYVCDVDVDVKNYNFDKDCDFYMGTLAEGLTKRGTLQSSESEEFYVVLKMAEDVSSDYQGMSHGEINVSVLVTQLMAEEDQFGNDYGQ